MSMSTAAVLFPILGRFDLMVGLDVGADQSFMGRFDVLL